MGLSASEQKFSADVSRAAARMGNLGVVIYRKIALDVHRGVVMESPVLEGHLRGNWNVALNRVDKTSGKDPDPSGAKTIADGRAVTTGADWTDEIYISNNLPYAARIEYEQWSKKAPEGMVRVTLKRIQQELAIAAKVRR
jgi:hypothetical protein